jgi:predicted enzyme related to lactoylglutathione lyase
VTISVPDLGKTVAKIGSSGVISGPVEIIADSGRKASVTDADGNTVSFIEVTTSGS